MSGFWTSYRQLPSHPLIHISIDTTFYAAEPCYFFGIIIAVITSVSHSAELQKEEENTDIKNIKILKY